MAWVLELDPGIPQESQLPVPVLTGNKFSLTCNASRPGITCHAETSTDLASWTTTGVTHAAPGPDGRSTASVPLAGPSRSLRLAIED